MRNSNYYNFRMAQAKKYEPEDFIMLNTEGEAFAEGFQVMVNGKTFQNRGLANFMRNKLAGYIIVGTFLAVYAALIICSIPFCVC